MEEKCKMSPCSKVVLIKLANYADSGSFSSCKIKNKAMKSQSRVLTEYFMALMNNSFRAANIRVIADKKNNSALMKSLCPMKTAKTYEPSS